MEIYQDTKRTPSERAKDLLDKMSLEEKMGQIVGAWARKGEEEELKITRSCGIGQISTLEFRSCESPYEAAAWQRSLQDRIMAASPHHIPAVFHMEGLCGAFIQDTTPFPSGVNRGASFDSDLEQQLGEIVSRQEAACGITQILAPVLDISRDSRMGRQSEPYGEDPTLSAAMGAAVRSLRRSIFLAFTIRREEFTEPMWIRETGCFMRFMENPFRRPSRKRVFTELCPAIVLLTVCRSMLPENT